MAQDPFYQNIQQQECSGKFGGLGVPIFKTFATR